jgi:hypothetical protein
MKMWLGVAAFLIFNTAIALANDCKLISDGNGTRVWQCASSPISDAASGQTKSAPADKN